jgi:hypothetical protein
MLLDVKKRCRMWRNDGPIVFCLWLRGVKGWYLLTRPMVEWSNGLDQALAVAGENVRGVSDQLQAVIGIEGGQRKSRY